MARAHRLSDPSPARPSAAVVQLPLADSDRGIVEALLAGRSAGGRALYDRHAATVRRVLTRVLGPDEQIGDLLQDVFITAIDSIDKIEDPDALRSWLASIAVFRARAEIRQRSRLRWFKQAPEQAGEPAAAPTDETVDEALRATYAVMSKLGTDERIAFALRYVEGMELVEVAAATEVSLATVKRRLRRAQDKFTTLAASQPALKRWVGGLTWK